MMRVFEKCFRVGICLFFFSIVFGFINKSYAVPACTGEFTCNTVQNSCLWTNELNELEVCISPGSSHPITGSICSCNSSCGAGTDGPWGCLAASSCPDPSALCSELCGMPPGGYACSLLPDACTVDSQCGTGSCCAGSPNYCSAPCTACNGSSICTTPTPTPTPAGPTPTGIPCAGTCGNSTFSGACSPPSGGNWQWDGNPSGSTTCRTNPSTYCYNCVAGPTPTPTPVGPTPTPTTPPPPPPPPPPGSNEISGTVYFDTNTNQSLDVADAKAPGIIITATSTSGFLTASATTNSSGNFILTGIGTTYDVYANPTTSYYIAKPVSFRASGGGSGNFLLHKLNIAGTVFVDNNQNGVYNSVSSVRWCKNGFWFDCKTTQPMLPHWLYLPRFTEVNPTSTSFYCYSTDGDNLCDTGETTALVPPLSPATWLAYYDNSGDNFTYCIDTNGNGLCGAGETQYETPPPASLDTSYVSTTIAADTLYNGAALNASASWPSGTPRTYNVNTTTTAGGGFTYTALPRKGTYSVNLTLPSGYQASLGASSPFNPKSLVINTVNLTANFPLFVSPPTCSGITKVGTPTGANLTANCTGIGNTYTWVSDPPSTAIGTPPPTSGTATFTAPPDSCANPTSTVTVTARNNSGTSTSSLVISNVEENKVIGTVYADLANDSCSTLTPIGSVPLQLWDGNPPPALISSTTTTVGGTYTLPDTSVINACSDRHIVVLGKPIRAVSTDGGPWTTTGFIGSDYGPFDYTVSPKTVDLCLQILFPWFQVDTGDVRFRDLINPIPGNNLAATSISFPGIFISSSSNPNFGGFTPSVKNWLVGREYSYDDDFKKGLGAVSYTFYLSQAKSKGITVNNISAASVNLNSLSSGVYQKNGDLEVTGCVGGTCTVQAGKHIILLVNGNATISDQIRVTANQTPGNLFILAAKGNINIPATIGVASSSTATSLEGIYSAEESINISTSADCAGDVPDLRLNVAGALISNALYPFETGQPGRVSNQRTLCDSNITYPTLSVTSRPDFLTQMTDFYKTTYKTFREVEP